MKRVKTEPIDQALWAFLREEGLETPLLQHRVVWLWPEVVGDEIAAHTQAVEVRDQTLWVRTDSPSLATTLAMRQTELARSLNDAVGSHVVTGLKCVPNL